MEKGYFPLLLKAWGYIIVAEFMCLIFAILTMTYYKHTFVLVIDILASLFIFGGIIFTYANNTAKRDKKADMPFSKTRAIVISFFTTIPFIILYIMLLLSKAELIGDFIPIYRLANSHLMPLSYLLLKQYETADISTNLIAIFGVMNLLPTVITYVTYIVTFKETDIISAILYDKKK